jgi:uncharacterized protein involved in cysteine biosynthesis
MLSDLSRAIAQLRDPKLFKLLMLSLVAAFIALGLIVAAVIWFLTSQDFSTGGLFGISFLDIALAWLIDSAAFALAVLIALMLFPAVAVGLQSLFLDDVADAVEAKYYPNLPAGRRQRIGEIVATALRLTVVILAMNIVLLFVWLIMIVTVPPLAPIPFYVVNSYLLGREYFELAALRRLSPDAAHVLRKRKLGWNMADGLILTFLFTIPIVNFAGPIIAAAYMTHRFHRVWEPGAGRELQEI